jgi:hypothetical protein
LCDFQIEKLRECSETGDENSRSAIREALDVFSRISRIAEASTTITDSPARSGLPGPA